MSIIEDFSHVHLNLPSQDTEYSQIEAAFNLIFYFYS